MSKVNLKLLGSIILLLLLNLSLWSSGLMAKDSLAIKAFQQANEDYRKGEYELAAQEYQRIIQQGYNDPFLYYNLANAYYKMGKLGKAILFYEKARRILPRDEDIQKNLAYVRSLTLDKIEEPKTGFFLSLWLKLIHFLTINELTIILTILYLLVIILSILAIFKKRKPIRRLLVKLLFIFGILFILIGGILSYRLYQLKAVKIGVIISKEVEVKSGSEKNLATLFTLHEGTSFLIQQKRGDWLQITLKNGWSGWVQNRDIGKI